ncbi:MAG: DUF302 domain-containing protein [Arenicellales bacterium]|jgi:uncharacterized protein (DUF302 family)
MKKIQILLSLALCILFNHVAVAQQGLVIVESAHDVKVTADKLEGVLAEKGMKVFARIDHAAGAASIGDSIAPTELVIFGNPKVGTGLIKCAQSSAIDLPMKALIWEDQNGQVWFGYNDAGYLASRHGMQACENVASLLEKISDALANFAIAATSQ